MRNHVKSIVAIAMFTPFLMGCATTPTQEGAFIGSVLGAGAGAIIGDNSNKAGEGALIGAAAGGLAGALVGDHVDERRHHRAYAPAPTRKTHTKSPQRGHYETRVFVSESGERYEKRVWVPHH